MKSLKSMLHKFENIYSLKTTKAGEKLKLNSQVQTKRCNRYKYKRTIILIYDGGAVFLEKRVITEGYKTILEH